MCRVKSASSRKARSDKLPSLEFEKLWKEKKKKPRKIQTRLTRIKVFSDCFELPEAGQVTVWK